MKPYLELLNRIQTQGEDAEEGRSFFRAVMSLNLEEGFPILTTRKMSFHPLCEEFLWMLSGSTDERELAARGVDTWAHLVTEGDGLSRHREPGQLGPVVGYQWRNYHAADGPIEPEEGFTDSTDQIVELIERIRGGAEHNLGLRSWNVEDEKYAAVSRQIDTQFHVVNGRLSANVYHHFSDAFHGVPKDTVIYALLTHVLAHATGMSVGMLTQTYAEVSIYSQHVEAVYEQSNRAPMARPQLELDERLKNPKRIDDITSADVKLLNYESYSHINAERRVTATAPDAADEMMAAAEASGGLGSAIVETTEIL